MLVRIACVCVCVVLAQSKPTNPSTKNVNVNITKVALEGNESSSIEKVTSEKVKDGTEEENKDVPTDSVTKDKDAKTEEMPTKVDVKDRTDIDSIVTVFNKRIGIDKKYYFKDVTRIEGGEIYKCKVGFSSGNVIFYIRCLLVSTGIEGEGIQEKAPFLFGWK